METSLSQTNFINSQIAANNGSLNINTGSKLTQDQLQNTDNNNNNKGNATIIGANLSAKDIAANIAGNLTVKSQQNLLEYDSYSIGATVGASTGGNLNPDIGNSKNLGFNTAGGFQSRGWVDNQTSIIGKNSVTINVGTKDQNNNYLTNTGSANIVGAIIANASTTTKTNEDGSQRTTLTDNGNLTINTKSLTYEDLKNYNNSESNSISINLQTGRNPSDPTRNGNLHLELNLEGSDQSSITKATIGNGNINIDNSAATDSDLQNLNRDITNTETNKRTVVTSDMNSEIRIDTRLLAAIGNAATGNMDDAKKNLDSYKNDVKEGAKALGEGAIKIGEALEATRETATENLGATGIILSMPTSIIEGAIFTFSEEKNTDEGSFAYIKTKDINKAFNLNSGDIIGDGDNNNLIVNNINLDIQTSTNDNQNQANNLNSYATSNSDIYFYVKTTDVTSALKYGLNGINTDMSSAFGNYVTKNEDVVLRHNPTHGILGDLVESGLGKVADWTGQEDLIAMNRIAAEDMFDRRNLDGAVNLYHSQGTIIGDSGMELYSKTFQQGKDLNGNTLVNENNQPMGKQFINQSQEFNAVGPAVSEGDWRSSVSLIGLDPNSKNNANWNHDKLDSVRYLAAPNNLINDAAKVVTLGNAEINSPVYIPNPISTVVGVALLPFIERHDVKNPEYMQSLQPPKSQEKTNFLQMPNTNNLTY